MSVGLAHGVAGVGVDLLVTQWNYDDLLVESLVLLPACSVLASLAPAYTCARFAPSYCQGKVTAEGMN